MELKIARQIAGLTQQELADRAGVDNSSISAIEIGRRDIRTMAHESVVAIARVLNITPEDLGPVTDPDTELKLARQIAGLTQQELADRAGIDNSSISAIEIGRRDIRTMAHESVVAIARALNVTAEELFPVTDLDP